ncbi:MAG TPA: hypothetical protein VFD03_09875, partial [Clostridia bacterium]|nr:hypothetical protein [Clostridia bacterium]
MVMSRQRLIVVFFKPACFFCFTSITDIRRLIYIFAAFPYINHTMISTERATGTTFVASYVSTRMFNGTVLFRNAI